MSGDPFRILTVCTGNICRSPAAERLLAIALGPEVVVTSAGTGALVGEPIDSAMAELMRADGVPVEDFSARQLTEEHAREANLILAMTRDHRAQVVEIFPGAVRRTFTLLEFAHLASAVAQPGPSGRVGTCLEAMLPLVVSARSVSGNPPNGQDIADPFRGSNDLFHQTYSSIFEAVETVMRSIR